MKSRDSEGSSDDSFSPSLEGEGPRSCRQAGAAAPDGTGVEGVADVAGRIAVDQQEVGAEALGDAAPVAEAEAAGRGRRGRAQGPCGCEAGRHQVLQFMVQARSVCQAPEERLGYGGVG